MPSKLKQLVVDRVDLVDRGANPDAYVVLFKRDRSPVVPVAKTTFTDLLNLQQFQDAVFEIMEMCLTLEDAIYSSLYADGDRAAEIRASVKQFSDAVEGALTSWLSGDATMKRDAVAVIKNIRARVRHVIQEGLVEEKDTTEPETEPETGDKPADAPVPTEADIIKSLPESLRKKLAFADEAEEAIAKSAKEKRDAEDRATLLSFEKRADAEIPKYPGTVTERAKVLMALDALPEPVKASTHQILRTGHAALVLQMASKGGGQEDAVSVVERVNALAKDRVEKKLSVTIEQAVETVLNEHPDWYAEYRKERKG